MKNLITIVLSSILLITGYLFYVFLETGYFREIKNTFNGNVYKSIPIPGVEDITISYEDDFLIFSSDDRASRRNGNPQQGALYIIDLKNEEFIPKNLTENISFPFNPHGIDIFKLDSSTYKILAINHVAGQHSIESFLLMGDSLTHIEKLTDPSMFSPNDLVMTGIENFYFTNDHGFSSKLGLLAENYLGIAASNIVFFDGLLFREVVNGIAYANGINTNSSMSLMFVASPRKFLVKVFNIEESGDLTFIENIHVGTGVDNIELAENGNILIGCHPDLLTFTKYAAGKKELSPSEVIRIDYSSKGEYKIETLFLNDGSIISASTVAPIYDNYIFVGTVLDDHFSILKLN